MHQFLDTGSPITPFAVAQEVEVMSATSPPHGAQRHLKPLPIRTGSAARKPSILVVDDEALIASVLDSGLRQAGFTVYPAFSGCGALELYARLSRDIDLVLLDVCLPDLYGPQILDELRSINPAVRCCFMTSGGGHDSNEQLLHAGAMRVFSKPFALSAVVNDLRELVGAQRL